MRNLKSLSLLTTAFLLLASISSDACTGLKVKVKNGNPVHGRTFEFGVKVDNSVLVIPRGYAFTGTTPLGKGLAYETKFAVVGTACFNSPLAMDGMNEKGLSVGTFYFPGYAGYQTTTSENQNNSLSSIDFPNWILTQFETLDEVKAGLEDIVIAPTIIKDWGSNAPPPFHYIVYDKTGNSIVIEPVDGELNVFDNPLGTFTNSPTFDWHMTNLRNFINLTPKNVPPIKVDGLELTPFGQGSGMVGLPGDFTPPSRFIRAAIYSITAEAVSTTKDAVFQTFHLLNQFDIPKGLARDIVDGVVYSDYTLVTVVHNPADMEYYFNTYDDQTIKVVKLNSFDLNAKELRVLNTRGKQTYVDISKDLKPILKN